MSIVEPDEDEADKERRAIVARYDRGYQADETDEWEDASYIVYQVTDRYGFMHKNPLANDRDDRLLIQERERGLKWKKMYDKWEKYIRTEKLRKRVYKGIPDSMRSSVWKALLEIDRVPSKTVLYKEFRARARLYSPDIRQIDLDVNRTYRDHIMFRDRYGIKQQDLFHVLAAYSMYNQEVGYCQGMSGVAALLLMYLNEEDAFWALSILVTNSKKHSMHGFFIPGFPKLKRFQDHHETILKKFSPKLFKHLEKEGVYTSLYTLKWFMQCFLDRVPFPMTLRIWDVFLLEGDKILTAMAYSLMKMHRKTFVKLPMEDIVEFLQEEMSAYPYNLDQIMEMLQDSIFELKKGGMVFPPAPSDLEFPRLKPGSSPFTRNTHETASARARKSKQKDKIIEIPTGRPLSPKSPASDDSPNRPVSGSLQSPVSHSGSSLGRQSNRSRNSAENRRAEHARSPETPPTHTDPRTISHVELHSETDVGSRVDPADGKGRVGLVLSSAEIARFNQDLKSSYMRSRRQNVSNPAFPVASSSQPHRHSEGTTPEHERSRGHPSTISLPGSVTIEPNLSSPNGARPRGSARGNRHTGSLPKYSSPASPVQNGAAPADITHAPVWQNEGPEGSMQFTLTQASNRQMTFV